MVLISFILWLFTRNCPFATGRMIFLSGLCQLRVADFLVAWLYLKVALVVRSLNWLRFVKVFYAGRSQGYALILLRTRRWFILRAVHIILSHQVGGSLHWRLLNSNLIEQLVAFVAHHVWVIRHSSTFALLSFWSAEIWVNVIDFGIWFLGLSEVLAFVEVFS